LAASPEGASPSNGSAQRQRLPRAPSRWWLGPQFQPQDAGAAAGPPRPQRRGRGHLPEVITPHTLSPAERTCRSAASFGPNGLTEQSEEIEWEVRLVRRRHVRHRYGPSCALSFWPGPAHGSPAGQADPQRALCRQFLVQVLLKKFEFSNPCTGWCANCGPRVWRSRRARSPAGLRKLKDLVVPLAGRFVLHSREGSHWQMDETALADVRLAQGQTAYRTGGFGWWSARK